MTRTAITTELQKFQNYLAEANLRFSAGRSAVFHAVMHLHGHFTAEELCKECHRKKRKVSRATVYRTLRELLEAGTIRETAFGDKHSHYEHVYDEKLHHHAKCVRCSKFIEFPDLGEDNIYHPFLKKQGFQILGHEMHFYGICRDCQKS